MQRLVKQTGQRMVDLDISEVTVICVGFVMVVLGGLHGGNS